MKSVTIVVNACVKFERKFKVLFMQGFFCVCFFSLVGVLCCWWFGVVVGVVLGLTWYSDFSKGAGIIAHTRRAFRPLIFVFKTF